MHPALDVAVETAEALLDLFFPPCCGGCGAPIPFGVLCAVCASLVERVGSPRCPRCATPFDAPGRDHSCGECLRAPPPFASTIAPFRYGGPIADGLRALKYGPRVERAGPLALLLRQEVGELPEVDLAVPVPLHPRRLRERGFNQVVLLARPLLRERRIVLDTGSLHRLRAGPAQAGLRGRARREGPSGDFQVSARRRRRVEGKRVLLLDDVMTTGATAAACARALLRAGAAAVHVVAVARV